MSDKEIRVMHVLPWLTGGGVEQLRLLLVRELSAHGIAQHVVYKEAKHGYLEDFEAMGVALTRVPGSWTITDLRAARGIAAAARGWEADILHGAVFEGVTQATLASRFYRAPLLVLEETSMPIDRSWRGHGLLRMLATAADCCVGVSPAIGDYLRDDLRIPNARVRVVDNGVQPPPPGEEDAREAARAEFGFAQDEIVIGSVGRINDFHKRFSDLVDAFALLAPTYPKVRLLIVGSGRDFDQIKAQVARLGLEDRVTMPGYRRDVGRLYRAMDIFALLSNQESFGLVLAEAMMRGLPVVSTTVGGMSYVVPSYEAGLHVHVGAPEEAARALALLVDNPALRRTLGERGREQALARFSANRYTDDMLQVYRDLYQEHRVSPRL